MGTTASHPVFARLWARMAASAESHGTAELRDRLLADAAGRVLELGAGSGTNSAHYPPAVSAVLAVEPEPRLRALAASAAAAAPVPVTVVAGDASSLPADDGAFDAAVVSLVLCSVPDQAAALAELRRVLRPGGRLHFWEHVQAASPGLARVQHVLDATVWPALGGGCHTGRDTVAAIEAAGFTVEHLERFDFPPRLRVNPNPTRPHVLGTALRP
jgi:ubiquinone/menaquinone biosynthesis C-methylase UbiE